MQAPGQWNFALDKRFLQRVFRAKSSQFSTLRHTAADTNLTQWRKDSGRFRNPNQNICIRLSIPSLGSVVKGTANPTDLSIGTNDGVRGYNVRTTAGLISERLQSC